MVKRAPDNIRHLGQFGEHVLTRSFAARASKGTDTQLIRLGGPNFNEIPVNQPKCPWANLQRDGHMRMRVAKGRVGYEPNTLAPEAPRAKTSRSFAGLTRPENGDVDRLKPRLLSA
jgi:catalase